MEKVQFTPNVPVPVALKYPEGKSVEGRFGDQMYYTLADGRCMYLDLDVAAKINLLDLRKGETFMMCKRWSGKKGETPQWDVWRPPSGELPPPSAARAAGIEDGSLERDLQRSLAARTSQAGTAVSPTAPVQAAPVAQPVVTPNGNGNKPNGHANGSGAGNGTWANVAPAAPSVPAKIPLNVAFREILRFCTAELKAAGEQWSDSARQDLVSTLLIQASKEGWCTLWERGSR
jgi:hypothetical protein